MIFNPAVSGNKFFPKFFAIERHYPGKPMIKIRVASRESYIGYVQTVFTDKKTQADFIFIRFQARAEIENFQKKHGKKTRRPNMLVAGDNKKVHIACLIGVKISC